MTYQEAYDYGKAILKGCDIDNAELDARLLLEFVCGTNRNDLLVHGDRVITEGEESLYKDDIEQRSQHIPLQHITQVQEFMGLEFRVNENVLIPRQDTECLVEEALTVIDDGMRVLDMCTGSGCILLSVMKYKNEIEGVGIDISHEALSVAMVNAQRLGVSPQFLHSDMFEEVEGKFDVILSNPPYIKSGVISTLMEEVRDYEPLGALDGKEDGMYFYDIIARNAGQYLYPEGKIFLEIGYDQGKEVSMLLTEYGFTDVTVVNDLAGLPRVVKATCRER